MGKSRSTSKWSKHKVLSRSSSLKPHLPHTSWLRASSLWRLLDRYGDIIVKPVGSYGGNGVIRIKARGADRYELQRDARKRTFTGKAELYAALRRRIGRSYIVQQRIALASVRGRPFDLRVMVQRKRGRSGPWLVTGRLAKVAGAGYMVTNVRRSGGRVVPLSKALTSSNVSPLHPDAIVSRIDKVSLLAARQIRPAYPWARTLGVDLGVDTRGHVWIIEVNFKPDVSLFYKLKDKSMFRRIKTLYKLCTNK